MSHGIPGNIVLDAKVAELVRRYGEHGVDALLLVSDQTRRKHTITIAVGNRSDQIEMRVVSEWVVTTAKRA